MSTDGSRESARSFAKLLALSRQGDSEAKTELLELQREDLLKAAGRHIGQRQRGRIDADDVVQETLLAAHRDFARFLGNSADDLARWLWPILGHTIQNFVRQTEGRGNPHGSREISLGDVSAETQAGFCKGPSACDPLIDQECIEGIHQCVEELPEEYQRVFWLRIDDGLPFGEIGDALGISADAARMKYGRAKRLVRQLARARGIVDEEG
jgi:RNA polymerase sigma-70 factor (ECF subfamily)